MSNTDPLAARRARSVPVLWPSVSSPPHFTRREVGFSHVRIDLDSVTRLVLDDEISLFPERAFFDDQVRPPTHIVRQLVDTEVRMDAAACTDAMAPTGLAGLCAALQIYATPEMFASNPRVGA